jgi:predicted RNA-binding Zn-ribbon protein involved in translation (DUF1610 family)
MRIARERTRVQASVLMCLSCGYDGAEVQHDGTWICPNCGQDLYERPPMSYAEMEGLDLAPRRAVASRSMGRWRALGYQVRLFGQWARIWLGVVRQGKH